MDEVRNILFAKMKAAGRSNEMSVKFKVMDTDELRVVMALSIMESFETIPKARCEVKNTKTSIDLRKEANTIYVSSKDNIEELIKAWELYSKSIALAPNTSQELAITYANRSALLMTLHKYTECIEDIERALKLNYPNHLKGKLLCRKIDCLNILNKVNVNDTIEEVRHWLENIKISNEERVVYEEKLKNKNSTNDPKSLPKTNKIIDLPPFTPNKEVPCASDALAINYNEKFGRHIVTTRKIDPGEILVVEKHYATLLMPEEVYTHCSYCLQVHWAMIPCEFCIHAMYCSEVCKNKAWKEYHDIECAVTGYLLDLDFGVCSLFSMRLAILALREAGSVEKLRNHLEKDEGCDDSRKKGFAEDGIYPSDKYQGLYSLVTNTEKRSMSDLFNRALNAAFILYYLCTLTKLFGIKFNSDIHKISINVDATYIGGLILRHMQIIPSNIHSYEEEKRIDTVEIGVSALPFCSLLNHSCDPNVSRCSSEKHMIIFALVPIQEGSQIFDNYGAHYALMTKDEREEKLNQYYFECQCTACIENWPHYDNLTSFHTLITNKETKKKLEKTLGKLNTYMDYVKEDQIEDKPYLLPDLVKMINTLIKKVPLPCQEVNNLVETLKRVIALTYGNKFAIPKLN